MMSAETSYSGKSVLVSGGLGFIGSNLALRLVQMGARVTVVDSMTPSDGGNLFNIEPVKADVEIHVHDAADQDFMSALIRDKDFLFNLAGKVSHIDSMRDPRADMHANLSAQIAQLEACRLHNPDVRVVYASTRQIYGRPSYLPIDEAHPVRPVDVNGVHKYAAESLHRLYSEVYGLRATSLRLTNTYGERQLISHGRLGFAGWFLGLALQNKEIQIFGDGSQRRDFIHVADAVDAFLAAGLSDDTVGKALNIANDPVVSLVEFVRMLIEAVGSGTWRLVPFPEDKKRIDVGDVYCNSGLFASLTRWKPSVGLREGLARMAAYYRQHAIQYLDT
jgi:UDP-glucose 4-epimerase